MKESKRENISSLLPVITQFEKHYWDSLQNEMLLVQKCPECGNVQFPPSPICTACMSDAVKWEPCSGKASLWSKVFFHKQYLPPYPDVPYGVALAKLEEGPIVTGRLAEENAAMEIDSPLRVAFSKTADGTVVIVFEPA